VDQDIELAELTDDAGDDGVDVPRWQVMRASKPRSRGASDAAASARRAGRYMNVIHARVGRTAFPQESCHPSYNRARTVRSLRQRRAPLGVLAPDRKV
jgi:hypothetical protein